MPKEEEKEVGKQYLVDVSKAKTIKDVKLILGRFNLVYTATKQEDLDEIGHLLGQEVKNE